MSINGTDTYVTNSCGEKKTEATDGGKYQYIFLKYYRAKYISVVVNTF